MANEIKFAGADATSRLVYYIKQRQPMITAIAKLSADLVEDGTTNKVFTATEQSKLAGIASGAEVNVINNVKVNGSALTPTDKAVDVLIKGLNTDNSTAQTVSASETITGSGNVNLHKISKTGTYSDLIGKPTLGTASALDTGTSQGNIPVLGTDGKLPSSVVPASAITDTFVVASQSAMLSLSAAEVGDIAVRTDINKTFILKTEPYSTLANWQELLTPTDAVTSVNGQTGAVSLAASDVGAVPTTRTVNSKALSSDITLTASDVGAEPTISLTTGRALVSNSNGKVAVSDVTSTELGYLDGVTSAIQTQLNNKQPTLTAGDNITITNNVISAARGVDEISTEYIRVTNLNTGIYKCTYTSGTIKLYYKGTTSTDYVNLTSTGYLGEMILYVIKQGTRWSWYVINTSPSSSVWSPRIVYGETSSGGGYTETIVLENLPKMVINNLTETTTGYALDATQGKALKDEIDTLPDTAITSAEIDALFS